MTDKNYTHVVMVVDRSGSMETMKSDAQNSINNFMKEQSKGTGKITVTLYDFNNLSYKVFGPIDAKEAPPYELMPNGGTALRDAMNRAITETGSFLRSLSEEARPGKVVFVTITDGDENASRFCSEHELKRKVIEQTDKYNWEFLFFGANIDAFSTGASYGVRHSVQYAGTGISYTSAYNNFSESLLSARATGASVSSTLATNFDADGNIVTNKVTNSNTITEGTTP